MFQLLLDPLHFQFFTRALLVGGLLGAACGVLGCFIVLRGMAFAGDALAHAVLPGVVVAYLLGVSLLAGALVAGLLTAFIMSAISNAGRVRDDTAIGIAFTGAFALGIALLSRVRAYTHLTHILLGNILGIAPPDAWLAGALLVLVIGSVGLWYRELLVSSFDPLYARAIGWNVGRIQLGLMALIAFAVVVGIQAVGVILITSLLVTPAATARLLASRLQVMLILAALLGCIAAVLGLYASYFLEIASSAAIVLTSTSGFAIALLFVRKS
jgi:ABC-type Mn2+/Zn2+ transport system permease subunit